MPLQIKIRDNKSLAIKEWREEAWNQEQGWSATKRAIHVTYTNVWIKKTQITLYHLYAIMSLCQGPTGLIVANVFFNKRLKLWVGFQLLVAPCLWDAAFLTFFFGHSTSTLRYMVHDVLITLSGYPSYSSEYKKCLKPSSGQHHPITPRLFASTLYHYKIFSSPFSARTRWNLPLASFQCFREISSTGSRLRRVSCKSLGKGVTNSYRVTKDWFSIFFWPKVVILEGCVWIYSSRPCYIDHSLIDKDALGETRTVWWTKSCAKWMLKHFKKKPWHIKCLPYEQRKRKCVYRYVFQVRAPVLLQSHVLRVLPR